MIENGFCPTLIRNGRKILVIEIKCINLRFLNTNAYIEDNEFGLAKQFNIDFEKNFFPMKFFSYDNFDYEGSIPDLKYFLSSLDNAKINEEKIEFHKHKKELNYVWNLKKEMLQYNDQKVWLLSIAILKFIKDCFDFQEQLNKILMRPSSQFLLSPFSYPLCSLGGFVFKLFKLYFLNFNDIYVVSKEYGTSSKNVRLIFHAHKF